MSLEIQQGAQKPTNNTEKGLHETKSPAPQELHGSAVHEEEAATSPLDNAWKDGPYYNYAGPYNVDSWATLKTRIDKYDNGICKGWREELDTILTFTGLFSAAVTAFCLESFKWLSRDSTDSTNSLLLIISQQLSNSSAPAASNVVEAFRPTSYNVQINVLYFLSLTLALSVSSVCILGKQWIREYQQDVSGSTVDALRVRQARFEALHAWKVPHILAALPVILQAALLLFFGGLLTQLWHADDYMTAGMVTFIVGVLLLLVLVTTVVPAHCISRLSEKTITPFRSPQAWIYLVAYQQVQRLSRRLRVWLRSFGWYFNSSSFPRSLSFQGWDEIDAAFLHYEAFEARIYAKEVTSVSRVLRWAFDELKNVMEMEKALYRCLQALPDYIGSDRIVANYVYRGRNTDLGDAAFDFIQYTLSTHIALDGVETARGRFQAELLLRVANQAIDQMAKADQVDYWTQWRYIGVACSFLMSHRTFTRWHAGKRVQQASNIVQDQAALMIQRLFYVLGGITFSSSLEVGWDNVTALLCELAKTDSFRFLKQPSFEQSITKMLERGTISPIFNISATLFSQSSWEWEGVLGLFTVFDKGMVKACNRPEGIYGLDEGDLRKWLDIRAEVIHTSRKWTEDAGGRGIESLPEHYFKTLHGPCAVLEKLEEDSETTIDDNERDL